MEELLQEGHIILALAPVPVGLEAQLGTLRPLARLRRCSLQPSLGVSTRPSSSLAWWLSGPPQSWPSLPTRYNLCQSISGRGAPGGRVHPPRWATVSRKLPMETLSSRSGGACVWQAVPAACLERPGLRLSGYIGCW